MASAKSSGSHPRVKPQRNNPARPLANAKRELFCQHVAGVGRPAVPVKEAYKLAGFTGQNDSTIRQLRWHPEVAARIEWLLKSRVDADTKRRHRAEKRIDDARELAIKKLVDIIAGDVRDVVQWGRKPQLDADGNVTGFIDELDVTPSHKLTAEQAAQVKSVFMKGGQIRVEFQPRIEAIDKALKALGVYADAAPAPVQNNLTVNQVNVGAAGALESVRKIAFLLRTAQEQAPVLELSPEPAKDDAAQG